MYEIRYPDGCKKENECPLLEAETWMRVELPNSTSVTDSIDTSDSILDIGPDENDGFSLGDRSLQSPDDSRPSEASRCSASVQCILPLRWAHRHVGGRNGRGEGN